MTFTQMLAAASQARKSLLCVGLDPDPARFPAGMTPAAESFFDFCAAIVNATADVATAFKPQIAYFAAHGAERQLQRLIAHVRQAAPGVPVILDAKRGDIGATARQYAREAFERYGADAVTLSPFMGFDSIEPYLDYADKGLFLLCRTSNPGGDDLQALPLALPGQTERVGSFGFQAQAELDAHRPFQSFREQILGGSLLPMPYGRPQRILPFFQSQLALRRKG